jgi:hypothetical protein
VLLQSTIGCPLCKRCAGGSWYGIDLFSTGNTIEQQNFSPYDDRTSRCRRESLGCDLVWFDDVLVDAVEESGLVLPDMQDGQDDRENPRERGNCRVKYHHLGIPTKTPHVGETYLEQFGVYCTDHNSNPFGIQWMRYDEDCTLPELVKTLPHVAFEVDDLAAALEGHEILIEPNSPSEGVLVAFVVCNGAPVEFLEYSKR